MNDKKSFDCPNHDCRFWRPVSYHLSRNSRALRCCHYLIETSRRKRRDENGVCVEYDLAHNLQAISSMDEQPAFNR